MHSKNTGTSPSLCSLSSRHRDSGPQQRAGSVFEFPKCSSHTRKPLYAENCSRSLTAVRLSPKATPVLIMLVTKLLVGHFVKSYRKEPDKERHRNKFNSLLLIHLWTQERYTHSQPAVCLRSKNRCLSPQKDVLVCGFFLLPLAPNTATPRGAGCGHRVQGACSCLLKDENTNVPPSLT